ncbi:MAG: hydroxyacid dehydrogenase [Thermoplasmata archaeon]|nr:hydroxyacid dehydrogenase [Thermoplasmata archaeon]
MKVLVTDEVAKEAIEKLEEKHEVVFKELRGEALAKEIGGYDALMVRSGTKVTANIINEAKNLKVIGRAGIGVDNIDIEEASRHGIYVVNSPGGSTHSVAELTIGHMLSLARHIPYADRSMREKKWEKKKLKGIELQGKNLGIIGFGRIGKEVWKIAKAFGMKCMAYDPWLSPEKIKEYGAIPSSIEDILKNADFITIHTPLTEETRQMISHPQFELMKRSAYIINCARGGIIDEDALYEALKNGMIAGAALDVYENEPYTGRLTELDNIVFTPHLGASTKEGQIRAGIICAEQIMKVLDGEEPDYWVNKHLMK